jgi:hypothetical protein
VATAAEVGERMGVKPLGLARSVSGIRIGGGAVAVVSAGLPTGLCAVVALCSEGMCRRVPELHRVGLVSRIRGRVVPVAGGRSGATRQQGDQADQSDAPEDHEDPEGEAPSQGLADSGTDRSTEHGRGSEPREDRCHCPTLASGVYQLRGVDGRDAEERAVRHGGHHPAAHDHPVGRPERR